MSVRIIHLQSCACLAFASVWFHPGVASVASIIATAPSHEITVGVPPALFGVGDLNGDQQPDVVVADRANDALLVYMCAGGGFHTPQSLALSGSPRALFLTDLNGDGHNDILVASSRRLHIFQNKGGLGAESIHGNNNLLARGVRSLSRGSLVEGGSDLLAGPVLLRWQPTRERFQNGYFRGPVANDNSFGILGDLDNSGIDEAVFAVQGDQVIRIYYGPIINPSVHVEELSNFVELKTPFVGTSLAIGDVNGDGRPDIVVSGRGGVAVFLQDSPTGFRDGVEASVILQGPGGEVALADLDGDGTQEWIVGDLFSSAANRAVYIFKPGPGGALPTSFDDAVQRLPVRALVGMQVVDFSGDGRLDIVVAAESGRDAGRIAVYPTARR